MQKIALKCDANSVATKFSSARMVWDGGGGSQRAKIEWYDIWTLPCVKITNHKTIILETLGFWQFVGILLHSHPTLKREVWIGQILLLSLSTIVDTF